MAENAEAKDPRYESGRRLVSGTEGVEQIRTKYDRLSWALDERQRRLWAANEVVVHLIASTKTTQGLSVQAKLDTNSYRKGIKVTDQEVTQIQLHAGEFHGEWNYTITPRNYPN